MNLDSISKRFTQSTLEEIIQLAGGTKYISHEFGNSCNKGDSYLSKVYRIRLTGNKENGNTFEVNLIIKAMPNNLVRRKVFRSSDFFRNEINFYTKIIPAWEDFQKRHEPCNAFTEYPICYASYCDGENDFIVLQDVSVHGYKAPKRQGYISLEDALLSMRILARFHAISLAFKALEPDKFQKCIQELEETYYDEKYREWYKDFLKMACETAKDAVSKCYPNTKYEIITANYLNENLYDDLIQLVSKKTKYSVIVHGDCWSPNFLTRYDENTGQPMAIKIIDFQLVRYASLALDIVFFIYSCTSQTLREVHYYNLLKEYHTSACELIRDLGANPQEVLPWDDFLYEIEEFGRFGCGMGIESLPMSMLEDENVADLDGMDTHAVLTDVWKIKPFVETSKRQRIADIFKHAIDSNYIK